MAADLFRHFSHEHPLIFEDEDKLDADDVKMKDCDICGLLMFINPSYSCSIENCSFSMHKQCADLPQNITIQVFRTHHDLTLVPQKNIEKKQRCSKCGQICYNFIYSTFQRYRNSCFHPFCALPIEIKTRHRSHHDHPMTPTHKKISASCDACGEDDHKDQFLSCHACNYWIHKECALLPFIGMHASHTDHPLILLYSNPFSKQKSSWGHCEICKHDVPIENAVYTCQACSYFVHLKCVKSQIKRLTKEESSKQIIVLPPAEKEYEVFPSFIIRNEQQEFNGNQISNGSTTKRMTPEECHDHPLTSHGSCNDNNKKDDKMMLTILGVCNACVQPISFSCKYYSCNKTGCHFLVHELCAKLSSTRIDSKFPGTQINLLTKSTEELLHIFYCDICNRKCNGFAYQINYDDALRGYPIVADVECASSPRIIKHQSHNHILHLIDSSFLDYSQNQDFNCCTSDDYIEFLYMCISCDFKIQVSCALLPKKVNHEYDHHPLQLITNHNVPEKEEDFCEFCEKDINLNYWYYKCDECEQLFHVNCIPSVGELSKFKFGGTIEGLSLSSHPHRDHPFTTVRMLTVGSQECGFCQSKIRGFEDIVALQCSTCDFWIHWGCARYILRVHEI